MKIISLFFFAFISFNLLADAESNLRGKEYFEQNCIGCHGPSSGSMATPILQGQHKAYIDGELKQFRADTRSDNIMSFMNFITKNMTDENIEDVANYLSGQTVCDSGIATDPMEGNVSRGSLLVARNYCTACHTEQVGSFGPRLRGQKTSYVKASLEAFKNKTRENANMYGLVSALDESMMLDIGAYLNSLSNCQ